MRLLSPDFPTTRHMRILFLTYEPWPTHRADLVILFGKYLRRLGITSDIVAEAEECGASPASDWSGGKIIGCKRPRRRPAQHVAKLWLNLKTVFGADPSQYDCIQVRDMSLSALAGLIAARMKGMRFVYWLSYLQSEGHIARARSRGPRAGLKYWYPLLEGLIGRFILYRLVLPRADHIFVQSDAMKTHLSAVGISDIKMTPVPMGVDFEESVVQQEELAPVPALAGRRPIIYLGIQDQERRVDLLLDVLVCVKKEIPEAILVMAGDTHDQAYRNWMRDKAERLGLEQDIIWTGWIPRAEAWNYVRVSDVGLSPFPRGNVLDTCSPTKAVEYMALGIPVVCNDNPDQRKVIESSGAGYCVPLDATHFADAVVTLLRDKQKACAMGQRGMAYVKSSRSYAQLAFDVAATYEKICSVRLVGTLQKYTAAEQDSDPRPAQ